MSKSYADYFVSNPTEELLFVYDECKVCRSQKMVLHSEHVDGWACLDCFHNVRRVFESEEYKLEPL
ncbi:hypothetical protein GQ42DRAFT_165393 [Ramicandelaber brevisporus]|nr:hypothetical protein GQ42DRAFT_165393 [Ramicandelaber brevisporus]